MLSSNVLQGLTHVNKSVYNRKRICSQLIAYPVSYTHLDVYKRQEEALLGLEDHWKRRLNGALDVSRSEPYFLEVVPCAIDKANSLGALLDSCVYPTVGRFPLHKVYPDRDAK